MTRKHALPKEIIASNLLPSNANSIIDSIQDDDTKEIEPIYLSSEAPLIINAKLVGDIKENKPIHLSPQLIKSQTLCPDTPPPVHAKKKSKLSMLSRKN